MQPSALRQDPVVPVGKAAAAAVAWRYRGELRVTVVVKATFAVTPDAAMPRVEPDPIAGADGAASELAPYLKRADVIFTGAGQLAAGAQVGLAVAGGAKPLLDKTATADAAGRVSLGPFPRARSLPVLGRRATEIPTAFDMDLFQSAPADQRTDYLRGDEWIVLEGLSAGHAELRTRLPGARAHARIHGLSQWRFAEGKGLAMNADVLHVRGDAGRCTVTWRGTFAIPDEAALPAVRIVAGVEQSGEPIAWPEHADALWAPDPRRGGTLPISEADMKAMSARPDATLPLTEAPQGESVLDRMMKEAAARKPPPAPPPPAAAARQGGRRLAPQDRTLGVPDAGAGAPKSPVLPFVKGSGGMPAIVREALKPRPRARSAADETLAVPEGTARPVTLPFSAASLKGKAAGEPPPPAEAPPPDPAAAAPPPDPPAAKAPAKEILVSSPSTDAAPAAKPAPRPKAPEKKLPPKVDVASKLYGPGKKR